MSRRVDSGRNAERRPVYVTSQRATMRRTGRHPTVPFGQAGALDLAGGDVRAERVAHRFE
jgi:hypothetical protein